MRIKKILVELNVEEKINKKHRVYREEIDNALFEGNPIYFKTRKNNYMAITLKERYITIVFKYNKNIANIKTAYPSSDGQIRLYKKRRLKK
ncbi:MAG: hypothetical protein AABW45_01735 [Nanoarchaeota archaeon]